MTLTMKIKFIRNRATFKVTNGTHETVTFDPANMPGVVDLRSLGYYKIKQGVLQQNLSNIYHFETANVICDQFNKLINTLRKEERMEGTEKYPCRPIELALNAVFFMSLCSIINWRYPCARLKDEN